MSCTLLQSKWSVSVSYKQVLQIPLSQDLSQTVLKGTKLTRKNTPKNSLNFRLQSRPSNWLSVLHYRGLQKITTYRLQPPFLCQHPPHQYVCFDARHILPRFGSSAESITSRLADYALSSSSVQGRFYTSADFETKSSVLEVLELP